MTDTQILDWLNAHPERIRPTQDDTGTWFWYVEQDCDGAMFEDVRIAVEEAAVNSKAIAPTA